MLFDNAGLERGETVLIQAGGSGIGTAAITLAQGDRAKVITTVGDADKAEKAKALGAGPRHQLPRDRFATIARAG